MYVSVNIVVCKYLFCILELLLRKHVFCYLARGSKTYATNKYLSIYLQQILCNNQTVRVKFDGTKFE